MGFLSPGGTHGAQFLGQAERPAPDHVKIARAIFLITIAIILVVAGLGMYAYGEFLPASSIYDLANRVSILACIPLIGSAVWIAASGHPGSGSYRLPRRSLALALMGVLVFGGLSWAGAVMGAGWMLHQFSPRITETRTYTVDQKVFRYTRSVMCDEGVSLKGTRGPFNALCGISYRDYMRLKSGDRLMVTGTASPHGFLVHDYQRFISATANRSPDRQLRLRIRGAPG